MLTQTPTLLADIGGTNARFALCAAASSSAAHELSHCESLRCADFASLHAAIQAYLQHSRQQGAPAPRQACLAVAAATDQDTIQLTNNPWQFSQQALADALQIPLSVINDFTAQAWCLPTLQEPDLIWLQRPPTLSSPWDGSWSRGSRCIAGPGTGFGAATMTLGGEVLESEPGQVAFAPLTPQQQQILNHLWQYLPRVSPDNVLSGPGLGNLHAALTALAAADQTDPKPHWSAAEIVAAAAKGDLTAREAVTEFNRILGAVCGDLALLMGSSGGFFLSGAMLTKMGSLFDHQVFIAAFNDKGAFCDWCQRVPVALLGINDPGLRGCAVYAQRKPAAVLPGKR
ncbi:MAG: glucokinase [Pseudomonadales bacterium]|nr:glucokinase [Pseudomonadales bacterium]